MGEPITSTNSHLPKLPLVEFESFSWAEEKHKVKIYIDCEDADTISDENIRFVRPYHISYIVHINTK